MAPFLINLATCQQRCKDANVVLIVNSVYVCPVPWVSWVNVDVFDGCTRSNVALFTEVTPFQQ